MTKISPRDAVKIKDAQSIALINGIEERDEKTVRELLAVGADPGHVSTKKQHFIKYLIGGMKEAELISPIAYSIRHAARYLLPDLLRQYPNKVPQGAVVDGKLLTLFELLPMEKDTLLFPRVVPDLACHMDLSAPAVAHGWWDMAIQSLKPKVGSKDLEFSPTYFALSILDHGGIPSNGVDGVLALLNVQVIQKNPQVSYDTLHSPLIEVLACTGFAKSIIERMLEVGLSPDEKICGIPLLHYASMANNAGMTQALIQAGADVRVACEWEVIKRHLHRDIKPKNASSALATAADMAEALGHDISYLLRSALARSAILDVALGAARKTP